MMNWTNRIFLIYRFNNHSVLHERYLLLNLLGKGGFSEVYQVTIFIMK